jgi:putative hemolysin
MLVVLLIIATLIAVNALYVAAEFAAVSVRKSRIQQLTQEGNALARRLLPVVEDRKRLDTYIAACQVGITLSSLLLGAYGQATLPGRIAPAFEGLGGMQEAAAFSVSAVVVLVGLTSVQVILGELVPKSIALQFPAQAAMYTVLPMRWSLVAFSWFIRVLNGSGLLVLRLAGAATTAHGHVHSPEEIDLLMVQSRDGGLLEPDEQRRLRRALHLSQQRAHQLMIPRTDMVAINAELPLETIVQTVVSSPFTRLPVYVESRDNIIGVIHTKDLALRLLERKEIGSLEEVLRPVVTVPDTLPADRLLAAMREQAAKQAIVVDEFGGVAGLVTIEDVLAEVLGDFSDEFKRVHPEPERLRDGRVRIPGIMRIDDAEPWLGVLWDAEADTVGGHIAAVLGRLPEPGEQVTIDGVELEVERVARHAVGSILARPVLQAVENDE